MRVLGIETSCDETGVAVLDLTAEGPRLLANLVASQTDVHAAYRGVVPELASRMHEVTLPPLLDRALADAGCTAGGLDLVAVTQGPGLVGALLVGLNFAKALAYASGIPVVPVHHLEGHLWANWLGPPPPDAPFVTLLVSGGHTELWYSTGPLAHRRLGRTRDDAAGEAFDKIATLLGLGYPGGPAMSRAAEGAPHRTLDFPRPMLHDPSLDFSFSGLKTAVLYHVRGDRPNEPTVPPPESVDEIAANVQTAIVDVLVAKARRALKLTGARVLCGAGGVMANAELRARLADECDAEVLVPPRDLCVDNGAMIAAAGAARFAAGVRGDLTLNAHPALPLPDPIEGVPCALVP